MPPQAFEDTGFQPYWDVQAETNFMTPLGPDNFDAPYMQDTDCVIEYNDYQWNDHEAEIELWKLFCGIVVHEYSHLMGYADTTSAQDPGSITNGVITSANWNIPQCRNRPKGAQ